MSPAGKCRRIVVAGGSLAGHTVVSELSRRGYTGEVVWARGEPVGSYSRPALSKGFIQGRADVDDLGIPLPNVPFELDVRASRVEALDPGIDRVWIDGGWVDYEALFICTGASAVLPPVFDGIPGVLPLRTLADAIAIRDRLPEARSAVVVGAGLVGSEMAASLTAVGLEINLVEQDALPMGRIFGEDLGRFALAAHRDHGVKLHMATPVLGVERSGQTIVVDLGDGGRIGADLVVLGVGARPNDAWLSGSGVDTDDGVRCRPCMSVSRPRVYAAGDVARWRHPVFGQTLRVEHWANASAQARHAVETWSAQMRGVPCRPFADIPYFWSDQYRLKFQMVGSPVGHDEVRASTDENGRPFVTFYRTQRLVAAAGVNAPRAVMAARNQITVEAR